MKENTVKKLIMTNIPNYEVRDVDCENLCYKAKSNGIPEIIVGPSSLSAIQGFKGNGVRVGVSIAYPSGAITPELKVAEIQDCLAASDMIDVFFVTCAQGYFMSGHPDNLEKEMYDTVKATEKPVYFIIEETALSEDQRKILVETAKKAGVKGLLISTAFGPYDMIRRPNIEDIAKIKVLAGDTFEIIAAGNIKTEEDIEAALQAGADRVMINITDGIVGV